MVKSLDGEIAIGAASILCYLRDLFTAAGKDTFTREEILVILECIISDEQIFAGSIGQKVWDWEDGDHQHL